MAETKKFVVVDGPINHDHELYQNGDPIELQEKQAKRLLLEKKVRPIKDEKPKDGDKSDSAAAGKEPAPKGDSEKDNSKTKGLPKGGKK